MAQLLAHVAHSVLDHDTGNQLNYGQLINHPKFQKTWNQSFSNEMGRLCQGVGIGKNNLGKRVEGTNTFHAIKFENTSEDKFKEIFYKSVVCEFRPGKKNPNRTRIKICVTNVCYPGYVGNNTASLELFKLMINSVLSRAGEKCV